MPDDDIQTRTYTERGQFIDLLDQLRDRFARVQHERDEAIRALQALSKQETPPALWGTTDTVVTAPPEAKPADCPASMTYGEYSIVKACIAELLEAGFTLSVNDGEETTVHRSTDPAVILAAMATTDSDYLLVHRAGDPKIAQHFGWVRFVYGNESFEVLSDYTTNLDSYLTKTHETIQEVEDRGA